MLNVLHTLQQVVKGAMNSITGCMLTSGVHWFTVLVKKSKRENYANSSKCASEYLNVSSAKIFHYNNTK